MGSAGFRRIKWQRSLKNLALAKPADSLADVALPSWCCERRRHGRRDHRKLQGVFSRGRGSRDARRRDRNVMMKANPASFAAVFAPVVGIAAFRTMVQ
jgi:hypothetical protein